METSGIGVFGGSGFYSLFERAEKLTVNTPYGPPSDLITVGEISGKRVAFLPRHGSSHSIPPHAINYRANLWAMKELGIRQIIGPCAAGSLSPDVKIGDFVICDQLVDRTSGRRATFYDGPITTHISFADPYCARLRALAAEACETHGISHHKTGTVVVIEGPRFSTRAESRWCTSMGWQVINMTQYPEAYLARELGLCYANISIITDYDAGLEGRPDIAPVSHAQVARAFVENMDKLRAVIASMVEHIPVEQPVGECPCPTALDGARIVAH